MGIHNALGLSTQHTLGTSVYYVGIGLHSGAGVTLRVRPAPADTGIQFLRKDAPPETGMIPARWNRVADTRRCTVLMNEHGVSVRSVEHLLAALHACNIDNAIVEIEGPEVPAVDGSAQPFVTLIEQASVTRQETPRQALKILKPVIVWDEDRFALLLPGDERRITVEIDFANAAIGFQRFSLEVGPEEFKRELARARTFGFLEQVNKLRRWGLARGGSLQNAIVLKGEQVLNEEGLRFPDEFARHKALDCVGDLALAGAPLIGHLVTYKPSHALTNSLIRTVFAQADAWRYTGSDEFSELRRWRQAAETSLVNVAERARNWWRYVA